MDNTISNSSIDELHAIFGDRIQEYVPLSNYTTARVGGKADGLLILHSIDEIKKAACCLWEQKIPFHILGTGANVLISDAGLRGVVLINRANTIKMDTHSESPTVWAESGAILANVAKRSALQGLSGLEWAALIPGTVGGAVYGNAGANDGNMQGSLILAEILHPQHSIESWSCEQLDFNYRSSRFKRNPGQGIILAARIQLAFSTRKKVEARMKSLSRYRHQTQPPGACMGSMFKNPPGDYAGRLIEASGLKGTRIGEVVISSKHANFFINEGAASATDYWKLIKLTKRTVQEKFDVELELEIELLGNWKKNQ